MNNILVESKYGHGAIKHVETGNEPLIAGDSLPFDWSKGYDVETLLPSPLPRKNQYETSACGGFASSYYMQVLAYLAGSKYEEKSAKFIYQRSFAPGGGSSAPSLINTLQIAGDSSEALCPSTEVSVTTEAFLEAQDSTYQDIFDGKECEITSAGYLKTPYDIDTIAQRIRDFGGVILGIDGVNNGTWLSANPKPPTVLMNDPSVWSHWVYACKAREIGGVKQIGILNSWGADVGENGIQWIDASYMPYLWCVWTGVYKIPIENQTTVPTAQVLTPVQVAETQVSLYQRLVNLYQQLIQTIFG